MQGRGPLPPHYADLVTDRSDMLQLAWGEPVEGAIYYPKSTWTEGRNRLLEEALARPVQPLYYIFLDDDVVFLKGGWREFEDDLLEYRPAVAVPLYPEYGKRFDPVRGAGAQTCYWYDAMYNAFHRDVVQDGMLLPYHTGLDHESWVNSQWFMIHVSKILYPGYILQMNKIWVANAVHESSYGKMNFNLSLKTLLFSVGNRRYLVEESIDWAARLIGKSSFKVRPAAAPKASYRLSESQKWRRLNRASPFWSDRRSAPLPASEPVQEHAL